MNVTIQLVIQSHYLPLNRLSQNILVSNILRILVFFCVKLILNLGQLLKCTIDSLWLFINNLTFIESNLIIIIS